MLLRADWLAEVFTTPYIPTLGPMHPAADPATLFEAVFSVAGTGRFLPYDKGRRWSDRKDESVLLEHTQQRPDLLLIATIIPRGTGRITVYQYGTDPGQRCAHELARKLAAEYGTETATVVWFDSDHQPDSTTILISDPAAITPDDQLLAAAPRAHHLTHLPRAVQASFPGSGRPDRCTPVPCPIARHSRRVCRPGPGRGTTRLSACVTRA